MSKLNKIRDGILQGVGMVAVLSITGLAYASYTWVSQSTVTTGDTLTASAWNDMVNNQNYLKQEVEARLQNSGGSMSGNLDMSTNKVTNLGTPTASSDAATKAYADSVGASSGGGVVFCQTRTRYTGNLGGLSGADSKCATECGAGFRFANHGEMVNFSSSGMFGSWVHNPEFTSYDCNDWTTSSTSYDGKLLYSTASSYWDTNGTSTYDHCGNSNSLACIKY